MNDSESTQVQYASFLVRLWRSGDPAPEGCNGGWQGEVEHIQSGQRWRFCGLEDLLATMRRQATTLGCASYELTLGTHSSEDRAHERV